MQTKKNVSNKAVHPIIELNFTSLNSLDDMKPSKSPIINLDLKGFNIVSLCKDSLCHFEL